MRRVSTFLLRFRDRMFYKPLLKLSGASSGESSIPKEGILNMIRSLTPQQAARNALAAEFKFQDAKKLRQVKPGLGMIDEGPRQPVRMGGRVCAFIEIGLPDDARGRLADIRAVFPEDSNRQSVFKDPARGLCDFRVNDFRQRVANLDSFAILCGHGDGCLSLRVPPEKHRAPAVDLDIDRKSTRLNSSHQKSS